MDKEFLQNIAPITKEFLKISLNVNELQLMDKCVRNLLKVSDMGKLRDMFEGDAFRNNFITRTSCEIAFEKMIEEKYIDWQMKLYDKYYKPQLTIKNKPIELISAVYGEYPNIHINAGENIIIAFYREPKDVLFCGFANKKKLVKGLSKINARGLKLQKVIGQLTDFSALDRFKDSEELYKLITS